MLKSSSSQAEGPTSVIFAAKYSRAGRRDLVDDPLAAGDPGGGDHRDLGDQPGAQHPLQRGVERAVGEQPGPAEQQVQPLAQLVAVQRGVVEQAEDCQLERCALAAPRAVLLRRSCVASRRSIHSLYPDVRYIGSNLSHRYIRTYEVAVPSCGHRTRRGVVLVTVLLRGADRIRVQRDRRSRLVESPSDVSGNLRADPRASRQRKTTGPGASAPTSRPGQGRRAGGASGGRRRLAAGDGSSGVGCWSPRLVVAVILGALGFFFAYRTPTIPDANKAFQAQTTYVYYSGGKGKIGPVRGAEPRVDPARRHPAGVQDAVIAAEDRTFYTNKRHRPQGHRPGRVLQRPGQLHPGRVDDHPAVREDPLPVSQERTLSRKVKEAFLSLKVQQQQSKRRSSRAT